MTDRYFAAALILIIAFIPTAAIADDVHPLMTSKYWINAGAFFAARDLNVSAQGQAGGKTRAADFESSVGVDDKPELFTIEAGWRFTENWSFGLQHFGSERGGRKIIDEQIEWNDLIFDVGADVYGESRVDVTRLFFSRRFKGDGPHSLHLGAGLHYLKMAVEYGGEVTLDDQTTEFDSAKASTSAPVPNIGAWYRYSPSDRWMLSARVDWFSANVGDIDGSMWNAAAGANYSVSKHFGIGLTYQFFQINATVTDTNWIGDVRTRFIGPNLQFSGYW